MSLPVAPLNAVRDNYLASDWHRILSAYHDDWELPENQIDDRRFALRRRLCEGANAIWAKPVRTWEDRIERAAMAVHWNQISKVVEHSDGSPVSVDDADLEALCALCMLEDLDTHLI